MKSMRPWPCSGLAFLSTHVIRMSAWSSPARNVEIPELGSQTIPVFFRPLSSTVLGGWVEPILCSARSRVSCAHQEGNRQRHCLQAAALLCHSWIPGSHLVFQG